LTIRTSTVTVQHRKEKMKNITLKIDDETHSKARIVAAQRGTSISALVREYLHSLDMQQTTKENEELLRVKRLEKLYAAADARAKNKPAKDPWVFNREECYEDRIR
jgi:plasmid stability protein